MDFENGLQLLFNAGISSNDACGIIRCTFPEATCDDVEWCYQGFMGNVPRIPSPNPVEAEPKTLTDLPQEVLSMIADNLNATDLKNLKVSSSYTLRYLNTDRVYASVQLLLDSEKMRLLTSGSELDESKPPLKMRETFLKEDNSRGDENGGRPRQESRYPFVDKAIKSLEEILDRQEVKIKKIRIIVSMENYNEQLERYCLEKIQRTMAGLSWLINVEDFKLHFKSPFPVCGFLTCLKPGTLTRVGTESDHPINMTEIVTLPHWRYLETFTAFNVSNLLFESLTHLNVFFAGIPTITPAELAEHKKNLLTKQGSFAHTIRIRGHYPFADCIKQLEPYRPIGVEDGKGYFLLNNQERCCFELYDGGIRFYMMPCNPPLPPWQFTSMVPIAPVFM